MGKENSKRFLSKQQKILEYNNKVINYNRVVSEELANRSRIKKATPDSFVCLQKVNKIYDNLVQAVYDFSLDIKKNEFIVLVGPSGCGKSTTLRMIAGLEEITAGNLFIDGKYANVLPSKDRDIAMVFQSYALYPHMSVFDNMAFSLKIKPYEIPLLDGNGKPQLGVDVQKLTKAETQVYNLKKSLENVNRYGFDGKSKELVLKPLQNELAEAEALVAKLKEGNCPLSQVRKMNKIEIREQVQKSAKILEIEDYLDRRPKELSGGQRQRVALGRAIVKNAKLFLMDEPLSNLDAKLRVSMRSEIKTLHRKINATTIYVTHDQTEAMTMADRIVVMNKGRIQQIGTPKEIYNAPSNIFVATFIGAPAMNILPVSIIDGKIAFDDQNIISLSKETLDSVRQHCQKEIQDIDIYINNGLAIEEKKQLQVKEQTLILEITNGKFKAQKDENKKPIDPFDNLKLNDEEKEICKAIYEQELKPLVEMKERYQKMLDENKFEVVFGIRPEDIYLEDAAKENGVLLSENLNIKVNVSELLGNEYYLHFNIKEKSFIMKALANNEVEENSGQIINLDMNKAFLFDSISEKLIK